MVGVAAYVYAWRQIAGHDFLTAKIVIFPFGIVAFSDIDVLDA